MAKSFGAGLLLTPQPRETVSGAVRKKAVEALSQIRRLEHGLQERGGIWRGTGLQAVRKHSASQEFSSKQPQRSGVIDIVPLGKDMDGKADFCGALQSLRKNHFGAPGDALEQMRVKRLAGQEIVASVGRRAEHRPIAGAGKNVDHLDEKSDGKGGTIRIQHARRPVPHGELPSHRFTQTVPEIGPPNFVKRDTAR